MRIKMGNPGSFSPECLLGPGERVQSKDAQVCTQLTWVGSPAPLMAPQEWSLSIEPGVSSEAQQDVARLSNKCIKQNAFLFLSFLDLSHIVKVKNRNTQLWLRWRELALAETLQSWVLNLCPTPSVSCHYSGPPSQETSSWDHSQILLDGDWGASGHPSGNLSLGQSVWF